MDEISERDNQLGVIPVDQDAELLFLRSGINPENIKLTSRLESSLNEAIQDLDLILQMYPTATILTSGRSGIISEVLLDSMGRKSVHLNSKFNNVLYKDLDVQSERSDDEREPLIRQILKEYGWVDDNDQYMFPSSQMVLVDDFVDTGGKHEIYKAFFAKYGIELVTIGIFRLGKEKDKKIPGKVDHIISAKGEEGYFMRDIATLVNVIQKVSNTIEIVDLVGESTIKYEIGNVRRSVVNVLERFYEIGGLASDRSNQNSNGTRGIRDFKKFIRKLLSQA